MAVNLQIAKELGITVPPSILPRADERVELLLVMSVYGSAPRRRGSSVEEESTRRVVD